MSPDDRTQPTPRRPENENSSPGWPRWIWIGLAIALLLPALTQPATPELPQRAYSLMLSDARDGKLKSISLIDTQRAEATASDGTEYLVLLPEGADPVRDLRETLLAAEKDPLAVEISADPTDPLLLYVSALLGNLFPLLLFLGLLVWLTRRGALGGMGGVSGMVRGRDQRRDGNEQLPTFTDVAGADEAKTELIEVVEFLRAPERFRNLGARIPRGVLLVGPPGTGKTLLARAVAGEAGAAFFSASASEFVELFVGMGARRVRELFTKAREAAPAIVFIDELDAVGRSRGGSGFGSNDEREQTLNQLLVEMDGFDDRANVIVLAATNRPDVLDSALLRPGRFDRRVGVDRPDRAGREAILRIHAKGKPLEESVNLGDLAARTAGLVGADLANLLNEAAILAARDRRATVTNTDLREALDRVVAGPARKSRPLSDLERRLVAVHEAGHAVVAWFSPDADPVRKVTIIGRGQALGYTMSMPDDDRSLIRAAELRSQIAVALGGHAAERLVLDELTTGSSNDIDRATSLARAVVTRYGMSRLGPIALHDDSLTLRDDAQSENTRGRIDGEIEREINDARDAAERIVRRRRSVLERLVNALLERETVEGDELEGILGARPTA